MNFIKSPAFWILLVCISAAPHLSEQVAQGIAAGSLSMVLISALAQSAKR